MFNYLLYLAGQGLATALPIEAAYNFAAFISDLRCLFAWRDCRIVENNLRAIFPEKSKNEIRAIRKEVFRNFARYLVGFLRSDKLDREYIRRNVEIENQEYLDQARSKGKGVIILTAHLGNWELGGLVIALLGYPLLAVVLPHKSSKVNDFFNSKRESKGVGVIPLGRAVRQCLNYLRNNKMVALVGDRDFTRKGTIVDFFGRPAIFPDGPAAIALKTQALIVPAFMLMNKNGTFRFKIEKPIELTAGDGNKEGLAGLIRQYKGIFEDYIKKYPEQWYMFRRFWVE